MIVYILEEYLLRNMCDPFIADYYVFYSEESALAAAAEKGLPVAKTEADFDRLKSRGHWCVITEKMIER